MIFNITKYMTQDDLLEQLKMLSHAPIDRVNYKEFKQMFNKWEKPMNKSNTYWDYNNQDLKLIKKRYDELRHYYE